jgi:lichenan operon transcriptional antiterminator
MKQKRLSSILHYLKEKAEKPVTASELSEELNVSVKTIHNDLVELTRSLDKDIAQIISQRGTGYYLIIKDYQGFQRIVQDIENDGKEDRLFDLNDATSRIQFLLEYLLFTKSYVRSSSFCRNIGLSRSQFTNDCSMVRDFIKPFNLKLVSKPHHGIKIEGSEFNRRLCIASAYLQRIHGYNEKTLFPAIAEYQELERLNKTILKIFKQFKYQVSDVIHQNLIIHLYVALKRIELGQEVPLDKNVLERLKHADEYSIATSIVEALNEQFHLFFPESEIGYVTMHLSGKRTYPAELKTKPLIDKKVDDLVTKMLDKVYQNYGLSLHADMELRVSLGLHLIPLLRRIEFGLILKNPLTEEIKTKITLAYEIAVSALSIINDTYSMYLNEDEIGYFALHFNLAMERLNMKNNKKNVLIVCSTGLGSAQLLKANFLRYYGGQVNVVHSIQVSDLPEYDIESYDVILSTIPLANEYHIPIIHVQTFLEDTSRRDIQEALDANTSNIASYFDEQLFFINLDFENKKDVLKYMCEKITKVKKVDKKFYEAVMHREKIATTSFGNLVAIPHPNRLLSSETFAAVGILNKPILWDDKKVQLVFLISIENTKVHDVQEFYQRVSRLLISRNKVRELIKNKSYSYLIQVLEIN